MSGDAEEDVLGAHDQVAQLRGFAHRSAERLNCLVCERHARRGRIRTARTHPFEVGAYVGFLQAQCPEEFGSAASALGGEGEEQVLGADLAMSQVPRFHLGPNHDEAPASRKLLEAHPAQPNCGTERTRRVITDPCHRDV